MGHPGKNGKFADPGYRCTTGAVLEPAENSPLKGAGAVIPNFTAESDVNIGAFQKADEKIAENAGVIEDDVPEIKQQVSTAKCEEKSEPVKAGKAAKTVKISDAVRLEWNIRNQVDSAYELLLERKKLAEKL